MQGNVVRHPAADQAPAREAADRAARLMHDAREEFIVEFLAWMRHAHPSRDDAMQEIEIAAATLRQLAQVNTRGG